MRPNSQLCSRPKRESELRPNGLYTITRTGSNGLDDNSDGEWVRADPNGLAMRKMAKRDNKKHGRQTRPRWSGGNVRFRRIRRRRPAMKMTNPNKYGEYWRLPKDEDGQFGRPLATVVKREWPSMDVNHRKAWPITTRRVKDCKQLSNKISGERPRRTTSIVECGGNGHSRARMTNMDGAKRQVFFYLWRYVKHESRSPNREQIKVGYDQRLGGINRNGWRKKQWQRRHERTQTSNKLDNVQKGVRRRVPRNKRKGKNCQDKISQLSITQEPAVRRGADIRFPSTPTTCLLFIKNYHPACTVHSEWYLPEDNYSKKKVERRKSTKSCDQLKNKQHKLSK